MDFVTFGDTNHNQLLLELPFPTLRDVCVKRIVQDFASITEGRDLAEPTSPKYSYSLGPFSNLDPGGNELVWKHLLKVNSMNMAWLSCLIVPHLRMCSLPASLSESLKIVHTLCHQLTELSLYKTGLATFPSELVCQVIQQNPGLQKLRLNGVFTGNRCIDRAISVLSCHCPELKALDIPNNSFGDSRVLLDLCGSKDVLGCPDLQEVNLEFVNLEGAETIVVTLMKKLRNLQNINICGTFLNISEMWEILHAERITLDIRELDVSCLDVTGDVFTHISSLHPNIQKLNCLDTSFFEGVKEDLDLPNVHELAIATANDEHSLSRLNNFVVKVGMNLRKLHIGNYCGYPTVTWNTIIENCPNLEHLDLSYCKINIPVDGEKAAVLKDHCPKMSVLILNRTEVQQNKRRVYGCYGLILGTCQELKQLSANSTGMAETDLQNIFSQIVPVYKIQTLELANTDVNVDSIVKVWMLAPCLEKVTLNGCKRINSTGYKRLTSLLSIPQRVQAQIIWKK